MPAHEEHLKSVGKTVHSHAQRQSERNRKRSEKGGGRHRLRVCRAAANPVPVGAPRASARPPARLLHCRMISSNACLCSRSRRLSSSEMWRFQRGKSAARRPDDILHAGRAPQHRQSERGLAAATRSMRRPAGAGRPAAPQLTSTHRPPPTPSGTVFRLLTEMVLARAGSPAPSPDVLPHTHARCLRRRRALVNDVLPSPEALRAERRPLGGVGALLVARSCGWEGDRKGAASARLLTLLLVSPVLYVLSWL